MVRVDHILAAKKSQVITVEAGSTVLEALQLMADHNVGALPVAQGDRLVGIFSERDYARKVILLGKNSTQTHVSEIMSENVFTVGPQSTVEECMHMMSEKRIRHLPVLEDSKLVGILSIGDIVKTIIQEQLFKIEQLESYIKT
ncbi:MAG: CBS domain-containing protein [Betaproteobacteria bacterium]|jgi:CBS domain-containing protein